MDTRQLMVVTEPDNYTQILNFLAVNSILVHSGSEITPQITIDWLTLDDDDANIGNGTPHYFEISTGFGAHNMDAPALSLVEISFPNNLPSSINPNGGDTFTVQIDPLLDTVDPSTASLMVDTGAGFVAFPMTQNTATQFTATFPSLDCGTDAQFYISTQTMGGGTQVSPANAPLDGNYTATTATLDPTPYHEDNFQTDQGWVVSGTVTTRNTGRWERAVPSGGGVRGDAPSDSDGSGICYLTGNGAVNANNDVDDGTTILTSPTMSIVGASAISYARWYDNSFGASPEADVFVVEISDDNGASWTNLETVGPTGLEVRGGWITKELSLVGINGFTANDQFKIRFTASDLGAGSVVEAGIDAIKLLNFDCTPACTADLNGDGALNFFDISAFLTLFGNGDAAADFNGDGAFNFFDISAFLTSFGAGCP